MANEQMPYQIIDAVTAQAIQEDAARDHAIHTSWRTRVGICADRSAIPRILATAADVARKPR